MKLKFEISRCRLLSLLFLTNIGIVIVARDNKEDVKRTTMITRKLMCLMQKSRFFEVGLLESDRGVNRDWNLFLCIFVSILKR